MSLEPLHLPAQQPSPRVVIIHPDELLLDLLQYELERVGVAARALVPDRQRGFAALAPYLPPRPALCIVGLCPPYAAARALTAELYAAYPACSVVVTAADPAAALRGWKGRVCPLVHEESEVERTVAAVLAEVRTMLPRPGAGRGQRCRRVAVSAS